MGGDMDNSAPMGPPDLIEDDSDLEDGEGEASKDVNSAK